MISGLADRLAGLAADDRRRLLELLDEFTRPLTAPEIDLALAPYLTRRERRLVMPSLKHVRLVAIVPASDVEG